MWISSIVGSAVVVARSVVVIAQSMVVIAGSVVAITGSVVVIERSSITCGLDVMGYVFGMHAGAGVVTVEFVAGIAGAGVVTEGFVVGIVGSVFVIARSSITCGLDGMGSVIGMQKLGQ